MDISYDLHVVKNTFKHKYTELFFPYCICISYCIDGKTSSYMWTSCTFT